MSEQNDTLSTGTLVWVKAGNRGSVSVPIELLTEEQERTLRSGLESGKYAHAFELQRPIAHLEWVEHTGLYELLVADLDLAPEQKRTLRSPRAAVEGFSFRFTLSDMTELKERLANGDVDGAFVRELLDRQPWRPWQTNEWRLRRDQMIGGSCEDCGETQDLVLQHTVQPRKISQIVYGIVWERMDEFDAFKRDHVGQVELPLDAGTPLVPVCPKCGSSRVRFRQRRGNYICEKTRASVSCKHEFTTPEYGYDERVVRDAEKKRASMLREQFCMEQGIYELATVIALEDIISYLRMDHVKTLCKRCAFREDRLGLRLCKVCGVNYHSAGYSMCFECAKKASS